MRISGLYPRSTPRRDAPPPSLRQGLPGPLASRSSRTHPGAADRPARPRNRRIADGPSHGLARLDLDLDRGPGRPARPPRRRSPPRRFRRPSRPASSSGRAGWSTPEGGKSSWTRASGSSGNRIEIRRALCRGPRPGWGRTPERSTSRSATVLPGLIDAHTHVLLQGDITQAEYDEQILKESTPFRTIRATVAARIAVNNGFTAIRDLETEGAMYADVDVKRAIEQAGSSPAPGCSAPPGRSPPPGCTRSWATPGS